MLFQADKAVLGKTMYQEAFKAVENMVNFGLFLAVLR